MEKGNAQAANFALIGAAGYVAKKHLEAIRATDNVLLCALDKHDSVGILDSYFPKADFFTEFERFDRHFAKLKAKNTPIDYVSICSPNYLHDSHIRFAMRNGAEVICEKPLVLNPWNLNDLQSLESETGKRVNTILQLRLHPAIQALKKRIDADSSNQVHDIDLSYITPRGNWYYSSWKGDIAKSGGIATNIGIHFFDMLLWIFGDLQEMQVHLTSHDRAAGVLHLKKARVRWFLSINADTLPQNDVKAYRSLSLNGETIEFSEGFTDLHTLSYTQILAGKGFGMQEAEPSIALVQQIRNAALSPLVGDYHPHAKLPLVKHPFLKV